MCPDLTLDCEVVLRDVGSLVLVPNATRAADRRVSRPVNVRIWMARRNGVRWDVYRELLDVMRPCQRSDERCFHHRRFRTGVRKAIRRIAGRICNRQSLWRTEEAPAT